MTGKVSSGPSQTSAASGASYSGTSNVACPSTGTTTKPAPPTWTKCPVTKRTFSGMRSTATPTPADLSCGCSCSTRTSPVIGSPRVDDEQSLFRHLANRVANAFPSGARSLGAAVRHVVDAEGVRVVDDQRAHL